MALECVCSVAQSCLTLCGPWTAVHKALLSLRFPRQEYWSGGLPFPSTRDLPDPGIELLSLAPRALAGRAFTSEPPGKP